MLFIGAIINGPIVDIATYKCCSQYWLWKSAKKTGNITLFYKVNLEISSGHMLVNHFMTEKYPTFECHRLRHELRVTI